MESSLGHNALSMTTRMRDTSALAVGAALSGVLAYVFFALVTQALGSVRAAPVSVLWAYWSFAGAALTFPPAALDLSLGPRPRRRALGP